MKNSKYYFLQIIFIVLISTLSFSCTKETQENSQWKEAIVKNDGSPSVDGCGWVVIVQDTLYEPKTLIDSIFRFDSLEILLKYNLTGNHGFNCWGQLPQIDIKDIKKR